MRCSDKNRRCHTIVVVVVDVVVGGQLMKYDARTQRDGDREPGTAAGHMPYESVNVCVD